MEHESSLPHSQVPLPPVPILSCTDPVHTLASHFLKIYLNIFVPSTPGSSKWSFSLRFSHQNPLYTSTLPQTYYCLPAPHSSQFDHPNYIGWGNRFVQTVKSPNRQ